MNIINRIGTCRKKVMGLLRLMGNKADVVKGLAKRCNENWRVAPTSDIVSTLGFLQVDHRSLGSNTGSLPFGYSGPFDYHDPEPESLREDPLALA